MPIKAKVYNQEAKEVGEIELSGRVFGVKANIDLIHQAAVTQEANERPVLAHTKIRSEVRGGGRKPWRQKGTGRARAGSNRSPIWKGGGVTFGPRNERSFGKKINKKMKRQAINMVLTDKLEAEAMAVLDKLEAKEFKTKDMDAFIKNIEDKVFKNKPKDKTKDSKKPKRSLLIVSSKNSDKEKYSARNLSGVKLINHNNINIIDLLKYKNLVLTKSAVEQLQELAKTGKNE